MKFTVKPSDIYDHDKVTAILNRGHILIGFRPPIDGEYYICHRSHTVSRACSGFTFPRLIVQVVPVSPCTGIWE